MKYSPNIDYLFASIVYLGTNEYYWARTPQKMATELQLEEGRLQKLFDEFPGIFRKSIDASEENGQHYYSLQARYALREGKEPIDIAVDSMIKVMQPNQLDVVIDFVLKMAEQESKESDRRHTRINALLAATVAVVAAVLAATAAVVAAVVRQF
jgi:hypothetical protein